MQDTTDSWVLLFGITSRREVITIWWGRSHKKLYFTYQYAVEKFFHEEQPMLWSWLLPSWAESWQFAHRADFIMQNMRVQCNVIQQCLFSWRHVRLSSSWVSTCIISQRCSAANEGGRPPTSPLEYTNEEYANAKIAGLKMCESYNLQYGTNYIAVAANQPFMVRTINFHLENSHVTPAMMRKIYLAKLIHDGDWHSIEVDMNKRPINLLTSSAPSSARAMWTAATLMSAS